MPQWRNFFSDFLCLVNATCSCTGVLIFQTMQGAKYKDILMTLNISSASFVIYYLSLSLNYIPIVGICMEDWLDLYCSCF